MFKENLSLDELTMNLSPGDSGATETGGTGETGGGTAGGDDPEKK